VVNEAQNDSDDDWETEADYENQVGDTEQMKQARAVGDRLSDKVVQNVVQEDQVVKSKGIHQSQTDHSVGFGGKFGVQKDRRDSCAEDYGYEGKTEKHSSAKDFSKGFGGKFGVDKDRQDKSAAGWEHIEKVEKHESQTDYAKGFGGKFGVQEDRKDKSALGYDYEGKVQLHGSQTDYRPAKKPQLPNRASDLRSRFESMAMEEGQKASQERKAQQKSQAGRTRAVASAEKRKIDDFKPPQPVLATPVAVERAPSPPPPVEQDIAPPPLIYDKQQVEEEMAIPSPPPPMERYQTTQAETEEDDWPEEEPAAHHEPALYEQPPLTQEAPLYEQPPVEYEPQPVIAKQAPPPPPPQVQDNGLTAVALWDYEAEEDDEVTFDPGEIITHIEMIDEGWWKGTCRGRTGIFPANYVELQQ